MAYFVYRVGERAGQKHLEYLERHDAYRDARLSVRQRRARLPADSGFAVRMVFADSEEQAEALLRKKRDAPVLKEWEK